MSTQSFARACASTRVILASVQPEQLDAPTPCASWKEPVGPEARAMLGRYIAAFENADAAGLERLLRDDATLEATPLRTWFAGLKTCLPFMVTQILGSPGNWRMLPTEANGQPAAVAYCRDSDGAYQAYGVVMVTATSTGIAQIFSFGAPGLVAKFGFPASYPTPFPRSATC